MLRLCEQQNPLGGHMEGRHGLTVVATKWGGYDILIQSATHDPSEVRGMVGTKMGA